VSIQKGFHEPRETKQAAEALPRAPDRRVCIVIQVSFVCESPPETYRAKKLHSPKNA
jgi:hypothetical protein